MLRIRPCFAPLAGAWMIIATSLFAADEPSRPSPEAYRRLANQIERHWRNEVLAVWFPRTVDTRNGGFHSHFLEDWSRGEKNDKTIVYQSRMTWVAAQVARRYPELRDEYLRYTRHGVEFLDRVMWDRQRGGFYWGLDEAGKIAPSYGDEKHVYGISFGIYALAAAHEATGDKRPLELAQQTFAWLETHAHDSVNGGYHEALSATGEPILSPPAAGRMTDSIGTLYGYKSMNTHIHMLEALSALYHVWPDPKVEERLREVFHLVRDRIAVEPGCLNLFFTPDWRPVPDHDSFGHDVETAYLLIEAAEALGEGEDARTLAVARSLVDHALQWGWDKTHGGFYDKGAAFATAWGTEKIWWTQAEGLNALLLMHELFGSETSAYFDAFLKQWEFIVRHQADPKHGEWHESVSAEGHAEPGRPKATIWKAAYHNGRALMEVTHRLRSLAGEP